MASGRLSGNRCLGKRTFVGGLVVCVLVAMSFVVWSGFTPSYIGSLRVIAPVKVAKLLCRWVERQSSQNLNSGVGSNGTFWYRYNQPWRPMAFESCAFGFRMSDPKHKEGLLFHAQKLDGVFDSTRVAFLAVFLRLGQVLIVVKPEGASRAHAFHLSPLVDDGHWHWISLYAGNRKLVVVLDGENGQIRQIELSRDGLAVNSGLYFGGAVDSTTLLASQLRPVLTGDSGEGKSTSSLPLPGPFHGTLSDHVIVNGEVYRLLSNSFQRGLTEEQTGPYILDVIKYDLSKPISLSKDELSNSVVHLDVRDPAVRRVPVVTAVSEDHAEEVDDLVASVHYHMPGTGVIVYDLGLSQGSVAHFSQLCNVTVRPFRRDLYGGQVWQLRWYMWKPLLVHSALQEFGGAIYADSSIRFNSSVFKLDKLHNKTIGFLALSPKDSGSISGFTHDGLLNYFGVAREQVGKAEVAVGTSQIWFDQPLVRDVIMRQWLRCALDLKCMAPPGSVGWPCDFKNQYSGNYIGCHRYDQSALSVALFKLFHDPSGTGYLLRPPRDLHLACIIRKSTTIYPRCWMGEQHQCTCNKKTPSEVDNDLRKNHPYCFPNT